VERERGAEGVRRVLELAGLAGQEDVMRDESQWFSFETKLVLWRAGEEFAILLPSTDAATAHAIAGRARAGVAALPARAPLTCSAGVATAIPGAVAPMELLGLADGALYRAKHRGRDQTVLSDGDGGASVSRHGLRSASGV
jgi:predicted signal transduction protein with EAL and GGDEF domain